MFLFGCQYHFDFGILYSKKTQYFAYINFFVAAVHLSLNYMLIKQYGIWGAVWASVTVVAFQTFLYLLVSNRNYPIKYELRRVFSCLSVAVIFYILAMSMSFEQIVFSIIFKLMLLSLFLITLVLLKIVTPGETIMAKAVLFKLLPKKITNQT